MAKHLDITGALGAAYSPTATGAKRLPKRPKRTGRIIWTPGTRLMQGGSPTTTIINGRLAVSVMLHGDLARSKRMVMDDATWNLVSTVLGTEWHLLDRSGHLYVVAPPTAAQMLPCAPSVTVLARWIVRATEGEVVSYRDGDTLNLMRGNLRLEGRQEFMRGLGSRKATIEPAAPCEAD